MLLKCPLGRHVYLLDRKYVGKLVTNHDTFPSGKVSRFVAGTQKDIRGEKYAMYNYREQVLIISASGTIELHFEHKAYMLGVCLLPISSPAWRSTKVH